MQPRHFVLTHIRSLRGIRRPTTGGSPAIAIAAVCVAAFALVLVVPATASAHATVVSTQPGDGSLLKAAPKTVSVTYDEQVEVGLGTMRVFAPDGSRCDVGAAYHVPGYPHTVAIAIGGPAAAQRGTFTVAWRVVSADSHPVSGGFTYSVGVATAVAVKLSSLTAQGSRAVGVVYGAARWLSYLAFALLLGAVVFLLACWRDGATDKRMRRLIAAAWFSLSACSAACLLLQGPYGAGLGLGQALSAPILRTTLTTRLGEALIARLAVLLASAPLLLLLVRRLPHLHGRALAAPPASAALLGVGLAATWPLADHADTGIQVPLAVALDTVHLIAMAVWLGGLAVLAAVLLPRCEPDRAAAAVARFSPLAFGSVVALAVTGSYQLWRSVGTLPALTDTAYGRLLLGKIAGFCLLVGLGATARRRLAGRPAGMPMRSAVSSLRGTVAVETCVGVSILLLTAVLVNAEPARTAYAPPVYGATRFDTGGPNGRGTVSLSVLPARVGYNDIDIDVFDPAGRPEQVSEVDAALLLAAQQIGPLPVQVIDVGPGRYQAVTPVAMVGAWQLRVTVRSDQFDETTVAFPLPVH